MAINIAPKSLDTELSELMRDVTSGKAQLPEFQRSWTWDDGRIRGILASLSQGYPMGAIMRLECGNENVKFKYRPIEGVKNVTVAPDHLILDGQQRLTTIMLLLRAFYDKFANMKDKQSINVRKNIARCVWKTDEFDEPDMDALKIDSEVASDNYKVEFLAIL